VNRRETQRTYCPGTLFIPRFTGLPGSFCVCMIIGWSNVYVKTWVPNERSIVNMKNWIATFVYSSANIANIAQMRWDQLANYCDPIDDFAVSNNA